MTKRDLWELSSTVLNTELSLKLYHEVKKVKCSQLIEKSEERAELK